MLCWILFKLKYHALDLSRLWVANGSLLGHCSFPFCHYPSIFTSSAPYDPYPRTCASLTLHLSITISSHGNLLIVLVMTIMTSGSCCLLAVFLHTRAASEYDVREPFYTQSQNGRGRQALLWVTQSNPLPKQGHPEQAAQDHVQAGLEYLQRRRLHNLPGQPVPCCSSIVILSKIIPLPPLNFVSFSTFLWFICTLWCDKNNLKII